MNAITAGIASTGTGVATWTIGTPRLLAGLDRLLRLDHDAHLATHGALPGTDLPKLLGLLDAVALGGRGGAGFPLAAKLRAMQGSRPTVVVNGTESEPASQKDRTLLRRAPHLVLDGAIAVGTALGARRITVAVHDAAAAESVRAALDERTDTRIVRVQQVSGGFVSGEARALVRALRGGPAVPPGRRDLPTDKGILVSNVETLAQTAVLLRIGARDFAATGTRDEPGTVLLTVGGAVARPGVVEVPFGTPLHIVLRAAGAHDPRFVVTGGYHGTWVAADAEVPISRAGLAAADASLGAGVLLAVDGGTCAVGELARVAGWLAAQSAQQCGPCQFGLPALADDVVALAHGRAGDAPRHLAVIAGRGACAHPDGAVRFVGSGLRALADEVETHRRGGCGLPVRGLLPIGAGA